MFTLIAKNRKIIGKETDILREKGLIPAVLYGPKIKNISIEVDVKEFNDVYKESGENSLINLEVDGKKYLVLIYDLKINPINGKFTHVDFYQPNLEKKIESSVPVILEGEASAVKSLGGTLYKNVSEIDVKALPQSLPKDIKIDISSLIDFEDHIKVKDLIVGEGVEILRDPEDIIISVSPPTNIEEELAKPVEEKIEEVEKIEKEKKEEIEEK